MMNRTYQILVCSIKRAASNKQYTTSAFATNSSPKIDFNVYHNDYCVVVDETDKPLGRASKWDCHYGPGKLHRAFSLFMFNERNEILLQQRAACKPTFPLFWANACCSHPLHNEEALRSDQAHEEHVRISAIKRVRFELGIAEEALGNSTSEKLHYVTRIHYEARHQPPLDERWCEKEIDYIMILTNVRVDLPIELNRDEVHQVRWFARDDLDEFMHSASRKNTLISPWFALIYRHFLGKWWDSISNLATVTDRRTIYRPA